MENKLKYLSTYWKNVNDVGYEIREGLKFVRTPTTMIGKYLGIIQYKDMDNWSVKGKLGLSENLSALADKINAMIYKGDAINVEPMVRRIVFKGIKKQSHPPSKEMKRKYEGRELGCATYLGHGHFRWNFKAYTLDKHELEHLKKFFNL